MKLETLSLEEINKKIVELEKTGINYFNHIFFGLVIIGSWDGYIFPNKPFFPNPIQKPQCSKEDYDSAILYHKLHQSLKEKLLR